MTLTKETVAKARELIDTVSRALPKRANWFPNPRSEVAVPREDLLALIAVARWTLATPQMADGFPIGIGTTVWTDDPDGRTGCDSWQPVVIESITLSGETELSWYRGTYTLTCDNGWEFGNGDCYYFKPEKSPSELEEQE